MFKKSKTCKEKKHGTARVILKKNKNSSKNAEFHDDIRSAGKIAKMHAKKIMSKIGS